MKSATALRWIAIAAAAASLALFLHWAWVLPAVASATDLKDVPPFSRVLFTSRHGTSPEWFVRTLVALVAITGFASSGLALLILRTRTSLATLRLAAALALGSLAGAYFFVVLTHSLYREWLGGATATGWRALLDFGAYFAGLLAPALMMRFFISYPRAATLEEWQAYFARDMAAIREQVRTGWRKFFYPGWSLDDVPAKSGFRRLLRADSVVDRRDYLLYLDSPRVLPWLAFLAGLSALGGAFSNQAGDESWARWVQLGAWGASYMAILLFLVASYEALKFHFRNSIADDRAKIDWIYSAMLVGGMAVLVVPPLWWAALIFLIPILEARQVAAPGPALFMGPFVFALQLFVLSFVAALALSVFYRGAVDPRLAVRRISLFGLLGIVVAFLFVLVERAVAVKVVAWLGLPAESGPVLAGAVIAATFSPIRVRVEKVVNDKAALWLPLESLVAGERKRVAILLSDLSGYTALSAKDEKEALLLAALLQRMARAVAEAGDGRLVKSMGDAVMLAFPDPHAAAIALEKIHREFGPAASALGLTPLPVHSGGHVGEVTETQDGDVYGQTVNIAARLQGLAEQGRCVVSEEFAREAGTPHRTLGPQRLKNVPEPVECMEPL